MTHKIDVPLKQSETDDNIEILNIKVSNDEKYLAVLSGKNLIKSIEELHSLHIYEISPDGKDWTLKTGTDLPESFRYFSVTFIFSNSSPETTILFADVKGIMKYNYITQTLITQFKFQNEIGR